MNKKNAVLWLLVLTCTCVLPRALSAATIGIYDVNAQFNTAGCPYDGTDASRNPFRCPTAEAPGPYIISLTPGTYEITMIDGEPGNDFIWEGNASGGMSITTPRAIGTTVTFDYTGSDPIALYWYDWVPFDNDPAVHAVFEIDTASAPEPGTFALFGVAAALVSFARFRFSLRGKRPSLLRSV